MAADDPPVPAGLKSRWVPDSGHDKASGRKDPEALVMRHREEPEGYSMGMNTLKPERPLFVVLRSMKSLADEWPSPSVTAVWP